MARPREQRRRWLTGLCLGMVAAFVVLRAFNGYGDPTPWSRQPTDFGSLLSFLNCEKYPPSFLFLLRTLGPSIGLLRLFDAGVGRLGQPLVTVGRVPLFYYVLHLYLIHAAAIAATLAVGGSIETLRDGFHPMLKPPDFGFSLTVVYAVWVGVVLALYLACRWFAGVKQRRKDWWLSYL